MEFVVYGKVKVQARAWVVSKPQGTSYPSTLTSLNL